MHVVAINGSPRADGNTHYLIKDVFTELEKEGISCELIQLGGKKIHGCVACYKCFDLQNKRCSVTNDFINTCIEKIETADGIILGSPTYFANVTTEMKALVDRAGMVSLANGAMLRRKVGAAVVAVRRGGANHVFNSINHFFFINQMIVPGSSYWNFGVGREKGDVLNDEEGRKTMENLGKNMAWLMKKIDSPL